jgi:hypothetical protein
MADLIVWRWREALAADEAPVLPGRRFGWFCDAQNIALNSILSRKANCCLAHLQKKPGISGLLLLEVERRIQDF